MNRSAGLGSRNMGGFSLIEAMVGLTLGIITVLIITQTFVAFETSKSTTTAGTDAQENGLVALDIISQDARNAGVGMADTGGAWDCANFFAWRDDGINPSGAYGFGTAPVEITDGGAASDSITFRIGQTFLGAIPTYITTAMPASSSELNVNRTLGFADGDLILVTGGGNCTLMQVTQVQGAALKLQHNPGNNTPAFNPTVAYQNNNGWPAYGGGAKIYNMGNIVSTTYSINASRDLQVAINSLTAAVAQTQILVRDVVAMQAQYGVAAGGGDVVNAWVDATGAWAALDANEVKSIKAVRIVVVARASKREAATVTATVPTMRTTPLNASPVAIPGINTLSNWQNYRYKVYETVIPLRNVLWANL